MRRIFCKYTDYEVFRQTKVILFFYFFIYLRINAFHLRTPYITKRETYACTFIKKRHRRRNNSGCAFGGVQAAKTVCRPYSRPSIPLQFPTESISRSGFITNSRSCMCGCGSVRSLESICTSSYISISMSIGRS